MDILLVGVLQSVHDLFQFFFHSVEIIRNCEASPNNLLQLIVSVGSGILALHELPSQLMKIVLVAIDHLGEFFSHTIYVLVCRFDKLLDKRLLIFLLICELFNIAR